MLSLLPSSDQVSSYASSSSYPATLQSSYGSSDLSEYNAANCYSEGAYPSPPMSSSPSGTFPGHARAFDPYAATRGYTHHPGAPQGQQQWAHPVAYQAGYPQQHGHHGHVAAAGPSPRSPRGHHIVPAQYVVPHPHHANYAYAQPAPVVRGYPTPEGVYPVIGSQPLQPTAVLGSSAPGPGPKNTQKLPRRTKPHVVTACYNCKKAHLSCEEQRPCQRCKSSGKTDSCFNVAHKRRGRPRIRDGNGHKTKQNPTINTTSVHQHLKPTIDAKTAAYAPDSAVSFNGVPFDRNAEAPRAFLNAEFVITKINQSFKNHFDFERDPVARTLEQLIDSSDKNTLNQLRDSLHEEKQVRQAYLPPLRMGNGDEVTDIPNVDALDLTTVTSQGFTLRESNLRFRFRGGNVQNLSVTLQLAKVKADHFFIVLTLPLLREDATAAVPTGNNFQQPRPIPQVNTSSYAIGSMTSPQVYSAVAPQHRGPASATTPASPYYTGNYTLSGVPQSATAASPMTPGRSQYEYGSYQFSAGLPYAYTAQPAQAMPAVGEPRHFQAYAGEPGQIVQYPPGQQMLPGYPVQLPPIYAQQQQQERPRSVQGPPVAYIPREADFAMRPASHQPGQHIHAKRFSKEMV